MALGDQIAAAFGAEDAMDEKVGKFMGHESAVPEGTRVIVYAYPALPRRAFLSRACGTGAEIHHQTLF